MPSGWQEEDIQRELQSRIKITEEVQLLNYHKI